MVFNMTGSTQRNNYMRIRSSSNMVLNNMMTLSIIPN